MSAVQSASDAGFILHTYPYRETSLIVEAFSRTHGRVALIAKGARRPRSVMRGVLLAFQPLGISWFGKAELKTLKTAESQRIYPQLSGAALLSGFYLNELLLKLSHRDDPHEGLFEAYDATLRQMHELSRPAKAEGESVSPARQLAPLLRQFERRLLAELGYGLMLEQDSQHAPIQLNQRYAYVMEKGPVQVPLAARQPGQGGALELQGKSLLDIARDDYRDPVTAAEAKQLMRHVLNHHLNGVELHTRQLIRELQQT